MTTRSMVLLRWASTAAGNSPTVGPPAGSCWILKSITMRNQGTVTATVGLFLAARDGTVTVAAFSQPLSSGQSATVQMWTMVMQTDAVWFNTDQALTNVWLSGAQLPFP